jgi:uncharacterized protein (DUF488 family)
MEKKPIYTIGHGSRKAEELLALLQQYGIQYLVDVRSQPYSRFHPQFSRNNLKHFLEENKVRYVFMGDSLGGRPIDASCYRADGSIDYNLVKKKDFFKQGIERLKLAYDKDVPLAIMCSERNPADCHRTKLIGAVLQDEQIQVKHITEKGMLKDQNTVMQEVKDRGSTNSLF